MQPSRPTQPHSRKTASSRRLRLLRPKAREFVGLLKKLDAAYPANTVIKVILDEHSAHIFKETKAWLENQPEGRFSFVFTSRAF